MSTIPCDSAIPLLGLHPPETQAQVIPSHVQEEPQQHYPQHLKTTVTLIEYQQIINYYIHAMNYNVSLSFELYMHFFVHALYISLKIKKVRNNCDLTNLNRMSTLHLHAE